MYPGRGRDKVVLRTRSRFRPAKDYRHYFPLFKSRGKILSDSHPIRTSNIQRSDHQNRAQRRIPNVIPSFNLLITPLTSSPILYTHSFIRFVATTLLKWTSGASSVGVRLPRSLPRSLRRRLWPRFVSRLPSRQFPLTFLITNVVGFPGHLPSPARN